MAKKVLITSRSFGQVSEEPLNILKENGMEVEFYNQSYDEERFRNIIGRYDALIIGAHRFSEEAMQKAGQLKIICKHGAGLDNIDLELARKYRLRVTNVPGTNSNAVADLVLGLMLDVARKISFGANEVKKGMWGKIIGTDVCGKTLGLIGFGAIARNVAKRAAGFDMEVLAYDPYIDALPEGFTRVRLAALEEVIEQADFLSLHVPLNGETKNLISFEQMGRMKKGSFIINTARGGIVNEADLYEHLQSGHMAGAGLDVTAQEPPTGSPLLTLDNVTIVPHIGMYSKEAINAVSVVCAKNVVKMFQGETPDYIVV